MGAQGGKDELKLLERANRHREQYRKDRAIFVSEERERHHMEGSVFFAGSWLPKADVARVDRGLRRHERLALLEVFFFICLMSLFAFFLWAVFTILLLP